MSGRVEDVGGDARAALAAWEHSLSRAEFRCAVALARIGNAEPETLGAILADLEERRRLVGRLDELARERARLERLDADVGPPALAIAFDTLARRAAKALSLETP